MSIGNRPARPDMNLATETKRILYVLNKTVERAKFAVSFSSLFHDVGVFSLTTARITFQSALGVLIRDDGSLLSDVLDGDQHFYVMQTCRK